MDGQGFPDAEVAIVWICETIGAACIEATTIPLLRYAHYSSQW